MTKFFVPLFAAAIFAFGTVNAQQPASPVKKPIPVNKMPVPVARPIVPVTKPAPSTAKPAPVVAKPVAPAIKPAAPMVAKPAPAPAPKPAAPVATKPAPSIAKPVTMPAAIPKAPVKKTTKTTITKTVRKTKKKAVVTPDVISPAAPAEMVATPAPYIRQEPKEETRIVREENNDKDDEKTEKESSCAPCKGSYHSINGCTCYKYGPDDCIPWKFRNRRYYRYNYTLEHYRNHDHCGSGCSHGNSCGPRDQHHSCH